MISPTYHLRTLILSILCLMFASSCSRTSPSPGQNYPAFLEHTLVAGETLGQLSVWYTGSEANWKGLFVSASSGGREKLRVGGKVLIPGNLLLREDPPTEEFLRKSRRKSRPKTVSLDKPRTELALPSPTATIAEPQNDLENGRLKSETEQLKDEFLGQIIDSTKLHSDENQLIGPDEPAGN